MRIPSGKTDQVIFFVAVDSTDLVTRKTGLTTFTVYRSRNGGTSTVYTTPTVAELDATHMPGVYSLLIDEDTSVASTSDSEEYCVHITQASMAPVTRTIELYRREVTTGNQLLVDSNGRVDVIKIAGTTQAAADLGTVTPAIKTQTDKLTFTVANQIDCNVLDWKGATAPAMTGDAYARLGAPSGASVSADIATVAGYIDTEVAAIKAKTDNLPSDPASASTIASSFTTVASEISAIDTTTAVTAIKSKTDNLPADPTSAATVASQISAISTVASVAAIKAKTDNLPSDPSSASTITGQFSTLAADVAAVDVTTAVTAIKAKTDNLPSDPTSATTVAGQFSTVNGTLSTIGTNVSGVKSKTDNLPASPAATGDIPTGADNADALLDRSNGIETGYTLRQTVRIMSAVLAGKSSGHPGSPVYRNMTDTTNRVVATVDSGNRSAVTLTG